MAEIASAALVPFSLSGIDGSELLDFDIPFSVSWAAYLGFHVEKLRVSCLKVLCFELFQLLGVGYESAAALVVCVWSLFHFVSAYWTDFHRYVVRWTQLRYLDQIPNILGVRNSRSDVERKR